MIDISVLGGTKMTVNVGRDEELFLFESFTNGDRKARDILIERNLKLVMYIARKFDNKSTTIEDLVSVGSIGLIKAIESFDVNRNIKLSTYASRCIENEILMYFRKIKRIKSEISLDEPLNMDGNGNSLLLSELVGTEEQVILKSVERNIEIEYVRSALNDLKPREREVILFRFGLYGKSEMTQKEVADHLGISQSYISRLEKKILLNLKKLLK